MPRLSITHLGVASQDAGGLSRGGILGQASAETLAYITAVETADGQGLEPAVLAALVSFANWRIPLGGACCILAGARTLAGALVPLVGPAPTGVNLVAGDYSRTLGLAGNGTNKTVATGYFNNSMAQNSRHLAINLSVYSYTSAGNTYFGSSIRNTGDTLIFDQVLGNMQYRCSTNTNSAVAGYGRDGFNAVNRLASGSFTRHSQVDLSTATEASVTPANTDELYLYSRLGTGNFAAGTINLYSAGPGVADMVDFQARVANLMSALAAALP